MTPEKIAQTAVSALAGVAVGWAAQALTLGGRVEALERGVTRIETAIERLAPRAVAPAPGSKP